MSADSLSLAEVQQHLPSLLSRLRASGFDASTDQYLDVNDLLVKFAGGTALPTGKYLRAAMSGVFASTADQQAEFTRIFDSWIATFSVNQSNETPPDIVDPKKPHLLWLAYDKLLRAWWWLLVLVVSAAGVAYFYEDDVIPIDIPVPQDDRASDPDAREDPSPLEQLQYPPRPVPAAAQVPPRYDPDWAKLSRLLWVVPVSLWLVWLLNQLYRRYQVATHKGQNQLPYDLSHIKLSADYRRLFASPELDQVWRRMRRYRYEPGSRLDVARTVDDLIRNQGYFQPHYRSRSVSPAYLALVDRLHAEDHVTGFSDEWLDKLEREQIQLKRLYYRGDPRYTRLSIDSGFSREPGELTALYPDHDLLLLADGLHLSDVRSGEPLAWAAQLGNYRRRWLFAPNPLWPLASLYRKLQPLVRAMPLTAEGIAQFHLKGDRLAQDNLLDLPLPRIIAEDPSGWLQDYKRPASESRALIEALQQYLGLKGYLLLAATAAYPRVYWRLTRALDQYLNPYDDSRIWRLRKISRLPWHRHGGFPLRIRRLLLRSLENDQLQSIQRVLRQLQTDTEGDALLRLPVHIPVDAQHAKQARRDPGDQRLDSFIDAAQSGEPLADPVFSRVIRGRKPRLHETQIFNRMLNDPGRAPPEYFLRALLLGLGVLVFSIQANVWLWERLLVPISRADALTSMLSDNSSIKVRINSKPDMQIHAVNLKQALDKYGFGDVIVADSTAGAFSENLNNALFDEPINGASEEREANVMRHNLSSEQLSNIAYPVQYQLYGDITPRVDSELPESTVEIILSTSARIFQDSLQDKSELLLPELRRISAGCFLMGSPDTEPERVDNERQQEVCISQDFDIGVYEVTFDQYEQFAQATDRGLPADSGWGRGNRPVMNVSWIDAVDYANWLSNETGSEYRLPTEAEWEYAARAVDVESPSSPFNTGDCISSDQANFDSTVAYADCPVGKIRPDRTVEVGKYPPNRWGLYDMHGNVWEWTCSIYQIDYQDAASDCANRVQEGDRVLRGGSWLSSARYVRSANRTNDAPTYRDFNVGFRVARAIR